MLTKTEIVEFLENSGIKHKDGDIKFDAWVV